MSMATAISGQTKAGVEWEMQDDDEDAWGFDDMDAEIGSVSEQGDAEAAWGFDDEQIDSAWGFDEETKTPSPTKSFPPVLPLDKTPTKPPAVPLSHSQAEAIIEEEEKIDATQSLGGVVTSQDPWVEQESSTWDDDTILPAEEKSPIVEDYTEPSEAEARFEEGLPLVSEKQMPQTVTEAEAATPEIESVKQATEDQPHRDLEYVNDATTQEPPSINRKSTEQVLSSIQTPLDPLLSNSRGQASEADVGDTAKDEDVVSHQEDRTDDDLTAWGMTEGDVGMGAETLTTMAQNDHPIQTDNDLIGMQQDELKDDAFDWGLAAKNSEERQADTHDNEALRSATVTEIPSFTGPHSEISEIKAADSVGEGLSRITDGSEAERQPPAQEPLFDAGVQPIIEPARKQVQIAGIEDPIRSGWADQAGDDPWDLEQPEDLDVVPAEPVAHDTANEMNIVSGLDRSSKEHEDGDSLLPGVDGFDAQLLKEPQPVPEQTDAFEVSASQHKAKIDASFESLQSEAEPTFSSSSHGQVENIKTYHPTDVEETLKVNESLQPHHQSAWQAPTSAGDPFEDSLRADETITGDDSKVMDTNQSNGMTFEQIEDGEDFFSRANVSPEADDAQIDALPVEQIHTQNEQASDVPALDEEWMPEASADLTSVKPGVATEVVEKVTVTKISSDARETAVEDDFFSSLGDGSGVREEVETVTTKETSVRKESSSAEQFSGLEQPTSIEATKSSDLVDMTGGGLAVSTTTVISQVLQESLAAEESPSASGDKPVKREDLSALWEAALGDDELLEEEPPVDPSAFFDDDGEGFLDEASLSPPAPTPVRDSFGQLQGFDSLSKSTSRPNSQHQRKQSGSSSRYAPVATSTSNQQAAPAQSTSGRAQYAPYARAAPVQPPASTGTSATPLSFANQNKGGYTSPFDAPMDLSRPKRVSARPAVSQQPPKQTQAPPPRTSSISSISPTSNRPPSSSGQPAATRAASSGGAAFFEELPIAPKVRPPSTTGRVPTPSQSGPPLTGPPQGAPPPPRKYEAAPQAGSPQTVASQSMPPPRKYDAAPASPPTSGPAPASYGLVAPARNMSFEENPQQLNQPPVVAAAAPPKTAPPSNRYSPAPSTLQQGPHAPNRYAPPPSGAPPRPPSVPSVPFQPRTSSPLAQHSAAYEPDGQGIQSRGPQRSRAQLSIHEVLESEHPMPQTHISQGVDPSTIERPNVKQRGLIQDQALGSMYAPSQASNRVPGPRNVSGPANDANFIPPTDERQHDPLKRWQGAPIFQFGFGGSVVTSFPKRLPRFVTGQSLPSIMCASGELKVHTSKLLPLDELTASFPGPLKSKGKKKDVLAWLDRAAQQLESDFSQGNIPQALLSLPGRFEERILLWKILRILVEYDGNVESNPAAVTALRQLLSPELKPSEAGSAMYGGDYQPTGIVGKAQSIQKSVGGSDMVEQIRKHLLSGDREKAVWHAVDQRLWGHAMLIASTLPKEIWKQVAQEFVKNDVKTVGDNVEPLAALYDIFAGNGEDSIDELVPSSARAGLQMMNTTAVGIPSKNAFDGLNHWRETLSLVLGNRSIDDAKALASLGNLLATYGRNEAAHICYLFARLPGLIGGAEEPQAAIVLLGENHRQQPMGYAQNLSSVLLTEVYEFATCVLASPAAPPFGHLQPFKLWHATRLAESGLSDQAQQYCDAINAALKSSTKSSPYYHAQLFTATDDLSSRLQSAPRDGSAGWMSRPSMDKVSGSVWNRFTQFVSGEESDAASTASKAEVDGPFARIAGTPNISRAASPVDQYGYGATNGYPPAVPTATASPAATNSRYAPKGAYAPQPAEIKKQPSYATMPSASPVSQGPPSATYQATPRTIPTPSTGPASRYSPINVPASSPEDKLQASPNRTLSQRPDIPEPSMSPSYPGAIDSEQSPAVTTASPAIPAAATPPIGGPPQERIASPYEPRTASRGPRSANYAPRPQASPIPAPEKAPESTQVAPIYEPPASPPSAYSYEAPTYPGAAESSYAPPTSSESTAEQAPSFSYQPPDVPQSEPIPAEEHIPTEEPVTEESSSYEPPLSMADIRARNKKSGYAPTSDGYEPTSNSYPPPNAGYEPPGSGYQPSSAGYEPPTASYEPTSASYEPPSAGYEPPSAGYQPPSAGYEPPSAGYEPQPTANGDAVASSPAPKRSMMDLSDDEDDLAARAAALKKSQRSAADRQADDAFRRAAEADAARDKAPDKTLKPKASGWLGGWFSRGKAEELNDPNAAKKPIKARLGEENSFVFDPQLKKWVNKNAKPEDLAAASAPTPPPPRGGAPPPRTASPYTGSGPPAGMPPMGGPPSRTASPAFAASNTPPTAGPGGRPPMIGGAGGEGGVPVGLAPGVAPPSRPGSTQSGLSNASSIDDLLGAPAGRKGGTVKGKKKGRGYVDVMAK